MKKLTGLTHVAPDAPAEAVEFAEKQIYAPAGGIEPVPEGAPRRSLQRVLCELLDCEINAGLQSFAFCDLRVWIGDDLNGRKAEALLTDRDAAWSDDAAIAHWLHETAIRLYPDSDYAKRFRPAS